nr:MAG TPA: hypothetical protein [Bacteriophage sp.]
MISYSLLLLFIYVLHIVIRVISSIRRHLGHNIQLFTEYKIFYSRNHMCRCWIWFVWIEAFISICRILQYNISLYIF